MNLTLDENHQRRFFENIMPIPESGCWLWMKTWNRNGYGGFAINAKHTLSAHRLSWQIHFGPIPKGMFVLHKCDTKPCVNPRHLFLGTNLDNMRDRDQKGRHISHPGEKHFNSRLTESQIIEILRSTESSRILSRQYGVRSGHIRLIKERKRWKHIII